MKRIPIAMLLLAGVLVGGCNTPEVNHSKAKAYREWAKSRSETYLGLATRSLESGRLDDALRKASEALSLDETNPDVRLLMVRIHIERTEYEHAETHLKLLTEQQGDGPQLSYYRGVIAEKRGEMTLALEQYQKAEQAQPRQMAYLLAVTETLIAMDRIAEADAHFRQRMDPRSTIPGVWELAARLAMRRKDYPAAVETLQRAQELDQNNRRYPEMLATALFLQQDYPRSAATLADLIHNKQDSYRPPAWAYAMLGDCRLAMNQPELAMREYQAGCRAWPDKSIVWVGLAKSALQSGEHRLAQDAARRANLLAPENPEAAAMLSLSLLETNRPQDARKILTPAYRANPQDDMLACLVGRTYALQGQHRVAIQHYNAVLRRQPHSPLARRLLRDSLRDAQLGQTQ